MDDRLERMRREAASVELLESISRSLHRLNEFSCNWGLSPRQEKRQEALEKHAEEIAKGLGLGVFFQRDPRGCALYLVPQGLSREEVEQNYPQYWAIY